MRTTCERCSKTPATLITSRKNLGMIFAHKTMRKQGLLCRPCATSQLVGDLIFTAVLGWWSVISLFANPACIAEDIAQLSAVRKMGQPVTAGQGTP